MRKALLSCLAIIAGTAMAMAQSIPEYPQSLNFTLNGEKELEGISVNSEMVPYDGSEYLKIDITGKSSSDKITMDFLTPEGWDYTMIATFTDENGTPMTTRSGRASHWYPISAVSSMGYKKGNSFNFPVNEKPVYGSIFLIKEDKVWEYSIDIEFKVTKDEGNSVDSVDSDAQARFFTLQGAEVANPEPGIYVKVINERAYRIILK